ncbi:MAG TPA: large-conductance mechanosensitive channel protein MscL [Polyangiaceae bacterium]|nr:large-conductance mechanosensitive channel protein MscL [Polyangiaceae bacterium]
MSIVTEFKEFAIKGNVVDMAVGVIVGGAFGKIVSSAVADVIMPPIGLLVGGVRFTDLAVTLREASGDSPAVTLKYGSFLQTVFDFAIIAIAVFLMVRMANRLKSAPLPANAAPPPPPRQEVLLEEIRDLLQKRP